MAMWQYWQYWQSMARPDQVMRSSPGSGTSTGHGQPRPLSSEWPRPQHQPRVTRARPGQPQVCGQGCGGWCHSRHYELMSPCHNVTLHSLDNEAPRPLTSIMVVSSLITLKLVSVVSIGLSVEPLTGWFP